MGASDAHEIGYAAADLDKWALRARTWAAGDAPEDLPTLAPTPKAGKSRDVFLFAISGFKERNPAAAAALLERLR
jgi:hypothetical protein